MEAEQETLVDILTGLADIARANDEAKRLMGGRPETPQAFGSLGEVPRAASRSLIKTVEQLQMMVARALRVTLILEQIDPTGWSPRAIADRAETLGLIENSDEWSDLVRLRNKLAHEYPISRLQQFAVLTEAWFASDRLIKIAEGVTVYVRDRLGLEPKT